MIFFPTEKSMAKPQSKDVELASSGFQCAEGMLTLR